MFVASNAAPDWSADMRPLTTLPPFIKVIEHRGTLSLRISLITNPQLRHVGAAAGDTVQYLRCKEARDRI
jgi:hypothetical protein